MKLFSPPFACNLSPTRVQILQFGVNFVSDLAQVGEVSHIASCNILAVNNNPLEDLP